MLNFSHIIHEAHQADQPRNNGGHGVPVNSMVRESQFNYSILPLARLRADSRPPMEDIIERRRPHIGLLVWQLRWLRLVLFFEFPGNRYCIDSPPDNLGGSVNYRCGRPSGMNPESMRRFMP
jgi:hypothetical protein